MLFSGGVLAAVGASSGPSMRCSFLESDFSPGLLSSLITYAGFKRSIDTVTFRPCMFMTKVFFPRFATAKGPSYGDCKIPVDGPRLTNTCTALAKSLKTKVFAVPCRGGVVGRNCAKCSLSS